MSPSNSGALATTEAIEELRARLAASELSLDLPGADEARRERTELIDQIDDYLLPRLRRLDAPVARRARRLYRGGEVDDHQ